MSVRLGVRIHREQPPETIVSYAQTVESLGFDEVWVVEDLTFAGGLTAAAAVLAATERITVGTGILAAVVRNPVYLAMEIATLERMFPGRIVAGIGHGVQSWMSASAPGPLRPSRLWGRRFPAWRPCSRAAGSPSRAATCAWMTWP